MTMAEAVEKVLDQVLEHQSNDDDETFVHCTYCDEWEGHKDGCPVAELQAWLEEKEGK